MTLCAPASRGEESETCAEDEHDDAADNMQHVGQLADRPGAGHQVGFGRLDDQGVIDERPACRRDDDACDECDDPHAIAECGLRIGV